VKPNSTKKPCLNILDVQTEDGLSRQIVGKVQVEEHLTERNVEQFSHAGANPLGYTAMGRELGHTGDTPMAEIPFPTMLIKDINPTTYLIYSQPQLGRNMLKSFGCPKRCQNIDDLFARTYIISYCYYTLPYAPCYS
jgi:hypothetical protein